MVVYYLNKVSERLADYRYPIKEGDICMLYDGDAVKTIYVDSETEADSIWRDFKFIDSKSLKSYHLPKTDRVLCAPVGDKHAIGDTSLLTQLIQECKGEWLLDFLNETSAVLSGFVDYWDLMVLRRLTGDDDIEIAYGDRGALSAFVIEHAGKDEDKLLDEDANELEGEYEGGYTGLDIFPKSYDIKWFCLSALSCVGDQMDKRSYQILTDTLKGDTRSEIASRFHLTQERIRQIVVKATKQAKELLIAQRKSLEEAKAENAKLKVQMNLLREDIAGLKKLVPQNVFIYKSEEGDINAEQTKLLETPISDISLSARAVNTLLYMKVAKFADIPQIRSHLTVLNIRNSGSKTVQEISGMLEDFHLNFGMSYTEIVDVLKKNNWCAAKRKWIREGEVKGKADERKDIDGDIVTESEGNTSTEESSATRHSKKDKRIGWKVKTFPSQHVGVIVNVRTDERGIKKIVVKTNDGNLVTIDDLPYLYEVLIRDSTEILRKAPKGDTIVDGHDEELFTSIMDVDKEDEEEDVEEDAPVINEEKEQEEVNDAFREIAVPVELYSTENRKVKPWTENEEELVTLYFRSGKDAATIANIVGRTEVSIKMRLAKLGLIEYTYGQDDDSSTSNRTSSIVDNSDVVNLDDYTIENSFLRCVLKNRKGDKVFSADGKLKRIGEKLYRLNMKNECFTIKDLKFDGRAWMRGEKKIVAYPNSALYGVMEGNVRYETMIEDIVDTPAFFECKVKVSGKWYNNVGEVIREGKELHDNMPSKPSISGVSTYVPKGKLRSIGEVAEESYDFLLTMAVVEFMQFTPQPAIITFDRLACMMIAVAWEILCDNEELREREHGLCECIQFLMEESKEEMDDVLTWNSTKKEVFNAIKDYPMAGVFEDTVDLLTENAPYHVLKAWLRGEEKEEIERESNVLSATCLYCIHPMKHNPYIEVKQGWMRYLRNEHDNLMNYFRELYLEYVE